jgi:drug/metabolite transporter (DMT)-like permease
LSTETFGHLAALGCAATWAIATLLYGKAAQTVDARALNLWKCALSAALLGVTALALDDVPHLSTRDAWALAASAVLGLLLADTAYFVALREIGPARGVLFVSLVPVTTALLAVPALDEPLTLRMAAGMLVTITGVTIVVRSRVSSTAQGRTWVGVVAGIIYCVTQAGANVLTKGTDPSHSPLALSVTRLAIGALLLGAILGVTAKGRANVRALGPVMKPATIATVVGTYGGLVLGTYALRTVSAGVATTLIATTPLFALVLTRVFTGETPPPRSLVGAVLALLGVALLVA